MFIINSSNIQEHSKSGETQSIIKMKPKNWKVRNVIRISESQVESLKTPIKSANLLKYD